jgi:hypothetical protein
MNLGCHRRPPKAPLWGWTVRRHHIKKILLQLGTPYPLWGVGTPYPLFGVGTAYPFLGVGNTQIAGVFDAVLAYDAGVDCVLPLGNVRLQDVRTLVHETVFARNAADLKNLAIFIGGSDVAAGEALLKAIQDAFFGPMRVSVMLDSNGCNTTAAAVVAKTAAAVSTGDAAGIGTPCPLLGARAVVLAGTGPVGLRTAALLAREGARVTLASRRLSRALAACTSILERFRVSVGAAQVTDAAELGHALEGSQVVVTAGAAGITLLPQTIWSSHPTLRILADVNAVPPLGIEGIEPAWDAERRDGRVIFGALGIGALKKRIHYTCLTRLFERNDQIFDAEGIGSIAKELERGCASSSLA